MATTLKKLKIKACTITHIENTLALASYKTDAVIAYLFVFYPILAA